MKLHFEEKSKEVRGMENSLKFHNEIILRFNHGYLREIFIDGIRQSDVRSFAITADAKKTASYLIEHSTVYSDSKEVANDFGSKLGEDVD